MKTIAWLKLEKSRAKERLLGAKEWLAEGQNYGIDLESLIAKVDATLENLDTDVIRVSLIGGFSEGKTALISAWLDQDVEELKIEESSDCVKLYRTKDDELEIVDTPGLFGYGKSLLNSSELVANEELTRQYISDSHLVLYVMNSVNPLKESHRSIIKWVMRDLNRLPITLFVFNKFDEVCDIEVDDDFREMLAVKRASLVRQLNDFIALSDKESEELKVVAIASNPYNRGVDLWRNDRELYQKLSHLSDLKKGTRELLEKHREELFYSQTESVIADVVMRYQTEMINLKETYKQKFLAYGEQLDELRAGLARGYMALAEKRTLLLAEVASYINSLVKEIDQLDWDDWNDFLEREIGAHGEVVSDKLQQLFESYEAEVNRLLGTSLSQLLNEVELKESILDNFLNEWVNKGVLLMGAIPSKVLEKALDYTKIVVKRGMKGLNRQGMKELSKSATSSSLGVVKGIQSSVVLVGALAEIYDLYKKHREREQLREAKDKLIAYLRARESDLARTLEDNGLLINYFYSDYNDLRGSLEEVEEAYKTVKNRYDKLTRWIEKGELLLKGLPSS